MINQYIPRQALLLSEDPTTLASLAVVLAQHEFSIHQAATVEEAVSAID